MSKLNTELTSLKTRLEEVLPAFSVYITDHLVDDGEIFTPQDSKGNHTLLRLVPDDGGVSASMEPIDSSYYLYQMEAPAQLLCAYSGIERDGVVDALLSCFDVGPELKQLSWDSEAITYQLTGEASSSSMNFILFDFVIKVVTDLKGCNEVCIK